jgi:hypothetical protein
MGYSGGGAETRTVDEEMDVLEEFLIQRLADVQLTHAFKWPSNELKNAAARSNSATRPQLSG